MLALQKIDPRQGAITVDYTSCVEVVAYPSFRRKSLSAGPHTLDPQNYSYTLGAECNARYVAEGTMRFPALDEGLAAYAFVFQTSEPQQREWRLKLRPAYFKIADMSIAPEAVVYNFLNRESMAKPGQRAELADIIAKNISDYFFDDERSLPYRAGVRHLQDLLPLIENFALEDYSALLEEKLKTNPWQAVIPQKYLYKFGPEIMLDKSKLRRVELKEHP